MGRFERKIEGITVPLLSCITEYSLTYRLLGTAGARRPATSQSNAFSTVQQSFSMKVLIFIM